ncbi:2-succinyl-6-hydroxy-2,4-cyclohexadiene-1-carboxylate synthase [Limosilactobacillus sp. STM2_1]|uniref:Putative 2-succinyl-6-hydroxy-2,4-cyclohexadiene-1-carboxylate synthase n=1 Tax=Limosilactobacillus rudii TaxID=2759755 RepID=A0A7W3ULB9_9LACO|nr:2-succinyl-6-hydroxy-2,4-cyclohexadiene-1-carboxylate synthase [Limosilactobacillus rudii]MBB1078805.1 2-succinyl-6-hydroxy-2,4-cyclohexadiene-1-carboxylate synthase [Limosilactobacillus rudii]MBB1097643.1 2-succinyl-6-hydroxy-2,4-cyclohexadiene-1-carboxylate synthase [Limosilactobacillus rudii]MCD7134752.1 2-succinyl-6-hydroxy-2,4-cyclohexadiene-1-carboxylate synthase [Limosilactobacillus rudii]
MTEVKYHYQWLNGFNSNRPTIVCLHGFTGTLKTFDGLFPNEKYNFLGIDLIGHGQTSVYVHPIYYRMENVVSKLQELMQLLQIKNYYLLGYSMGGRVALAWAVNDPHVQGLILESARPGIADKHDRQKRRQKDNDLAGKILVQPLEEFVNYWENIPLFASQKQLPLEIRQQIRRQRMGQQKYGLAMSLMMMGTGQQESYWKYLPQNIPVLLIVGELDFKFQKIAQEMKLMAPQMTISVLPSGHCVHIEVPSSFSSLVIKWLDNNL